MKRTRLEVVLATVVTTVWTISSLADAFLDHYEVSPFIHFAMMGILGAIFGKQYFNGAGTK